MAVHAFFRDYAARAGTVFVGVLDLPRTAVGLHPALHLYQGAVGAGDGSLHCTTGRPFLVAVSVRQDQLGWYALSRDTRQGMMNGHIRVGKEYPDITQLLLYSTGVQDQEFVVVYETADLTRFSDLVNAVAQHRGTRLHGTRHTVDYRRSTIRRTPHWICSDEPARALGDVEARRKSMYGHRAPAGFLGPGQPGSRRVQHGSETARRWWLPAGAARSSGCRSG